MKRILIEAVPVEQMRAPYQNPGDGDWFHDADGDLIVRVAAPALDDHAFLFALHETIEALLCQKAGISQEAVDTFDAAFVGEGEPGDDPAAPYRTQHRRACLVEFLVADMLGVASYGTME